MSQDSTERGAPGDDAPQRRHLDEPQPPSVPATPPPGDDPFRDPRLEIPEALRKPVEHPSLEKKPQGPVASNLGEVGIGLAIAIDFLATAGAGGLLGWGFDAWRGTDPVGLLVGVGFGFVVGTARLIHRLNKQDTQKK